MAPRPPAHILRRQRRAGGFTLIELMVTVAIAAILTVIAAPSFTQYQRNSELTRSANAFLASAMAARAEAMKRQLNTMIRPCPPVGSSCGDNWINGWQVYVDGDWDNVNGGSADVQILTQDALPTSVTIGDNNSASDSTSHYVLFNGAGYARDTGNASYSTAVRFTSTVAGSRIVKISPSGRMRVCNPASDTTCTLTDTF